MVVANLICFTRPSASMVTWTVSEPLADLVHGAAASLSLMASLIRLVYQANGAVPVPPMRSPPPGLPASPKASLPDFE